MRQIDGLNRLAIRFPFHPPWLVSLPQAANVRLEAAISAPALTGAGRSATVDCNRPADGRFVTPKPSTVSVGLQHHKVARYDMAATLGPGSCTLRVSTSTGSDQPGNREARHEGLERVFVDVGATVRIAVDLGLQPIDIPELAPRPRAC